MNMMVRRRPTPLRAIPPIARPRDVDDFLRPRIPRIIPIIEIGAPHKIKMEAHRLKTPRMTEAIARTGVGLRLIGTAFSAAAAISAKVAGV